MNTALVTGASGGVGYEVTKQLRDAGWNVLAHFRTAPGKLSGVTWWQADFQNDYTLPKVTELQALIHCAGVAPLGRVGEAPSDDWFVAMSVNLHAPVALTKELLPKLRSSNGHVVYLNSGAGLRSNPEWGIYAASKFAARAWCDALRAEEPRIRVTSIHPGRIDTPMQEHVVRYEQASYDASKYLRASTVANAVLHVIETPDDCNPNEVILRPRIH